LKQVDADLNGSFETTLKFLYDGFRCIEELNASDALVKEYVYGSLYVDELILQRTGATDYYFTHDYRYSVTSLTDSAGFIEESYDYKVYGERACSGSGLTEVGYTGQRHDNETGLMYFKNRYYSTSMGSFVTRDPLGYVDGLSMYLGYFGGQRTDAFGLGDSLKEDVAEKLSEVSPEEKKKEKEKRENYIKNILTKSSKSKVCPDNCLEITIFIELGYTFASDSQRKIGHTAISIGESFYDFGPSGDAGFLDKVPGSQYWDSDKKMRIGKGPGGINKQDIINKIKNVSSDGDVLTVTFIVKKEEGDAIEKYWRKLYTALAMDKKDKERPLYCFPGLNCTSAVAQSLYYPGEKYNDKKFSTVSPEKLLDALVDGSLKSSCGPNAGMGPYIELINSEMKDPYSK
jgi:RHS repeat-associated protein